MYTNNSQSQSQVWNQPHQIIIERWTKPRANQDGNGSNRGILLKSTIDNSNKWMTLWSGHHIFRDLKWGSSCHYDPNQEPHNRLKLGTAPQQMNQPTADYYSRIADQPNNNYSNQYNSLGDSIDQSYNPPNGYQPEINNNYQPQPNNNHNGNPSSSDNTTIDDTALEKSCLIMSNTHNLLKSMLPNVDDEEITKMTISIFIQHTKSNLPF